MKRFLGILILAAGIISGCTTVVPSEEIDQLALYQKDTYILKNDLILRDELLLKKGAKINIIMANTSDYVKVYAVNAEIDPLKSERILLLYMFDDDFKDQVYSKAEFEKRFFELVTVYKAPAAAPAGKPAGTKSK